MSSVGRNTTTGWAWRAPPTRCSDFLVKYESGVQPDRRAASEGKANPRYPGQKDVFQKTDEARYMNRRVSLTVMDNGGRSVSAGGTGSAAEAIKFPASRPAASPIAAAKC